MKKFMQKMSVSVAMIALGIASVLAQTKPAESTSKVKKVLLYNKVGGWMNTTGNTQVKDAFSQLASTKGFELVQSSDDAEITLDYLRQYQVIVWNNNTDGAKSVPNSIARQAILDYLEQGGGWFLIGLAGDHADSWNGLAEALGTKFTRHSKTGDAEIVLDNEAALHPELKWMTGDFPEVFVFNDIWLSFSKTVRHLPGVTVVATARNLPGTTDYVVPMGDGSGDNVYIWAREVGKGRLLYSAMGFGLTRIMAQQDSIVPKSYWEFLRYAAGDFQNGCTLATSPGFDPAARIHVEAMCSATGLKPQSTRPDQGIVPMGDAFRFTSPDGPFHARIRDLRGALVWERALPAGTEKLVFDKGIKPGVYFFEARSASGVEHRRLVIP